MKRIVLVLLVFALSQVAIAQRKALVIGNAEYTERPLRNPVLDAELISNSLEELGFSVVKVLNADRNRFNREINQFSQTIKENDEVVFFYSGHGLQVNGVNYLLPIKEYYNDEMDVEHKAVSLNSINDKLSRAKITIVFLDACRDNPYLMKRGGAQGLATVGNSRNDTFVMFSTEAGAVANDGTGQNSEFSRSLATHILVPGLSIDEISYRVSNDVSIASNGRQRPWRTNNIKAPYYFIESQDSQFKPVNAPLYVDDTRGGKPILEKPRRKSSFQPDNVSSERLFRNLRFLSSTEYLDIDAKYPGGSQIVSRNMLTLMIPWFGIEAEYNVYSGSNHNYDHYMEDRLPPVSQISLGLGMPDPEELRLFARISQNKRKFKYANINYYYDYKNENFLSISAEFAKRVRTEHQLSELYINYQYNDYEDWMHPLNYRIFQGNIKGKISSTLPKHRVEVGAFLSNITDFYREPVEFQGVSLDSNPLLLSDNACALFSVKFIAEDYGNVDEYAYFSDNEDPQSVTGAEFKLPIKFSRYFGIHFGYDYYQSKFSRDISWISKRSENVISGGASLSLLDFSFVKIVANVDYINNSYSDDDYSDNDSYLSWSPLLFIRPWKGLAIYAHYKNGGYGYDISDAMGSLGDESVFGLGMTLRM